MKVYKKELPKNVKKMFKLEKGIKVKVLNSLYYDKKKKVNKQLFRKMTTFFLFTEVFLWN